MKILYKYSLVLLLGLGGCEKSLEADIPLGKFISDGVFNDAGLADAAVRGIYASMTYPITSYKPYQEAMTAALSLSSDEYQRATYTPDETLILENNLAPDQLAVLGLWRGFYSYIVQCNLIVESAERSTGLSPEVQKRILAEARLNRALNFFYLVNIYGDVPLTLSSDYVKNALLPAATPAEIYKAIEADLLFAQDNLIGNSTVAGSRSRPTKWSATALLARVYLYQKKWLEAEQAATAVINQTGIYQLETLNNVFLKTSREAVWALHGPEESLNVPYITLIQGPQTANTAFILSDYTLSRFNNSDQRKVNWTKTSTTAGATTTAQFKFKTYRNDAVGAKAEVTMILRLAEQYLIRAEARAMQSGKLSDAVKDVDVIRTRAGAVADNIGANAMNTFKTIAFSNPSIGADDLVKVIYDERLRELFGEFGHRWFDAKRATNGLNTFFEGRKPAIENTDAYFPVPLAEIQRNINLTQRDGY